jgi:hypothetical protein
MHLTLVAPGLLALPANERARAGTLAHFARFATVARNDDGVAAATLSALGSAGLAPAPLPLGAGSMPAASTLLPQTRSLVAGRDDVRLAGRTDDLDAATAAPLIAQLNAHFRDDGLVFAAPGRQAGSCACRPALVPRHRRVGQPVFAFLPQGPTQDVGGGATRSDALHATPEHAARDTSASPRQRRLVLGGGTLFGRPPAVRLRAGRYLR